MPRKPHNIHYIYKTTNLLSGKYYIGIHSTSKLDDGYMGSGKRLRHSIRKYGKQNHIKEILEFLTSREELENREYELIARNIDDELCMNLTNGGVGFKMNHSESTKKKISDKLSNKNYSEIHRGNSIIEKEKRRVGVKKYWDSLTSEEKEKRSNVHRGKKGPQTNKEPRKTCPHCGTTGRASNLIRWHLDNCSRRVK